MTDDVEVWQDIVLTPTSISWWRSQQFVHTRPSEEERRQQEQALLEELWRVVHYVQPPSIEWAVCANKPLQPVIDPELAVPEGL